MPAKKAFAVLPVFILFLISACPLFALETNAREEPGASEKMYIRRMLFDSVSAVTGIPWYYLAAVDQYDRTLQRYRPKEEIADRGVLAIYYSRADWCGALNPDWNDTNPDSIRFFHGVGLDGDGDGKAERDNDMDVLYTRAMELLKRGVSGHDFPKTVWDIYQNSRSVDRIRQFAKIYKHFGTIKLDRHAFPVPLHANYSYRSTWGARRSYGGYRIHEGTDIFAGYGVPVRSTSYGIVEAIGWNRFGGWRVGIRDINNIYHYYAHLSGYRKGLKKNDVLAPGEIIGWVGSSGYGKPGTQGKFPPHLHYGMYRDTGTWEWSFDPYPSLRAWEREERRRK